MRISIMEFYDPLYNSTDFNNSYAPDYYLKSQEVLDKYFQKCSYDKSSSSWLNCSFC